MFACYGIIISMFFLKILDKLGRKRVVMDRGPSHPEYHLAKPWTDRYYLLFRKRPKWFPFNILIHHIIDNDHGIGLHNHPFPYITIILSGIDTGRQILKKKENGVENFIWVLEVLIIYIELT